MIEYFVPGASTYAGDIDFLFDMITVIVGFWFVMVLAVMTYFMVRFRRKEGVRAAYISGDPHSQKKWTHYPHYSVMGGCEANLASGRRQDSSSGAAMELVLYPLRP